MSVSIMDEVLGANFGDKRLDKRLGTIAEEFDSHPNVSIPAATTGRAEMEAAYRFFDNDKVTPDKILEPHFQATRKRIAEHDVVLLVQDTTELDLTRPEQQVRGAGPMDSEARRGAFLHPLEAFDLNAIPLGMVWQKSWTRDEVQTELTKAEKNKKRKETPIEEKESIRWVEGIRASREVAKACPGTTCVCVGDSESDIYELFSESHETPENNLQLLVRACQTRATTDQSNWLDKVRATPCLYTCSVDVSARRAKIAPDKQGKRSKPRDARVAEVEIRATTVTLRPPPRFDRKLPEVTVNVVLVEEADPPAGCGLLITTMPIDTAEQVQEIVSAYCIRWQIEIFFKTLKTGCRVEQRQFETIDRILNCLAVYSIVAWRIMHLCRLGRECPDLDCEVVFEPCEWKAVYTAIKRKDPPQTPPRLNEMIRLVASLGGYVIRKSTHPGPQTLWIGLQRVHDLSTAWEAFGPDS
ncbi:MAG: IS4 family transposase [Planctomycetales bacterium]|nr:IS4 family transposase [Planctomycetales bacterium]